ncbi:MAG: LysM peptidoglycan-binding domain-containing protein [Chloroflexi bacterium]|nr:LysM peptidoglycan-binding domain-containing protein [Chloroflexota bacterium]MBI3339605.1 LysM peptidoglycan-binding domain-containing protein [Chloroflexota bacterium]
MNKRLIWTLACLFGLLAIAFAPGTSGSALTLNPATASDLINAVNDLRASNGLPAYRINSILMEAAQVQADYMASIGTWSDYGPGGTIVGQRLLDAGYPLAGDLSGCRLASYPCGLASQNVIEGSAGMTAKSVVEKWTGDAPHSNTMLSPALQEIGAGVAVAGGTYYYAIDVALASGSKVSYTPAAPAATVISVSGTPATQDQRISAVIVSTPDENGNIYHVVQPGQTLWQIALAYKTTVEEIKRLNNISSNDIYEGDKLLIARAGTATPIPPTVTATRDLSTATPLPTLAVLTEELTGTATVVPVIPAAGGAGTVSVVAIVVVALFAAGLAAWAGRSRPV